MDIPGRAATRDSHVTKTGFLGKTDEVRMWGKSSPSSTDLDLSSWRPSQSQPNIKASEKGWCQWPRDMGASLQGMPLARVCVKLMGGEKGQEAHVQILWKVFIKLPLGSDRGEWILSLWFLSFLDFSQANEKLSTGLHPRLTHTHRTQEVVLEHPFLLTSNKG